MSTGYSLLLLKQIEEACPVMIGVQLGQLCVKKNIPVRDVAEHLGVSRVSVYAWFRGKIEVSDKYVPAVQKLIDALQ